MHCLSRDAINSENEVRVFLAIFMRAIFQALTNTNLAMTIAALPEKGQPAATSCREPPKYFHSVMLPPWSALSGNVSLIAKFSVVMM